MLAREIAVGLIGQDQGVTPDDAAEIWAASKEWGYQQFPVLDEDDHDNPHDLLSKQLSESNAWKRRIEPMEVEASEGGFWVPDILIP